MGSKRYSRVVHVVICLGWKNSKANEALVKISSFKTKPTLVLRVHEGAAGTLCRKAEQSRAVWSEDGEAGAEEQQGQTLAGSGWPSSPCISFSFPHRSAAVCSHFISARMV